MDMHANGNVEDNNEGRYFERLEKALKIYKMSELYLKDVQDDYGKLKIARLRMDFARHELISLMDEAAGMGINLREISIFKDMLPFEDNSPPDLKED